MSFLESLLEKAEKESRKEQFVILENTFGFIGAKGGVGTTTVVVNTAIACAKYGMNVLVIDGNVFKPSLYKALGCKTPEAGKGLLTAINNRESDIRDTLIKVEDTNVWLLSPSPLDKMEDYFDHNEEDIKNLVDRVSELFDIVLVDIPFNPPLAMCYAMCKEIDNGFIVWDEHSDCGQNTYGLMEFLTSIGINTGKLSNIVLNKKRNTDYASEVAKDIGCRVVTYIPYINKMDEHVNNGEPYILYGVRIGKDYLRGISLIVTAVLKIK